FIVASQEGETVEGRTVLLALGVQSVKSIDGEESFLGRGVSYCATCDGFLYKGKEIAVLCASKKYEDEVLHLASFAKKVTLIPLYKGCEISLDNVKIVYSMPRAVTGEKRVEKLLFSKPTEEGVAELSIDGLFVLKDGVSVTTLLPDLKVNEGHIVVDNKMQTSVKGVFAAGDCTGRPYQYTKAAGEGNVAAFAIKEYCQK
ncbi:MAG: FAD-dependent oxidoreductase, partial [Clostridia bacterium]|nr:FAD-dependent oxidoreductase [Clostridia bacterium]